LQNKFKVAKPSQHDKFSKRYEGYIKINYKSNAFTVSLTCALVYNYKTKPKIAPLTAKILYSKIFVDMQRCHSKKIKNFSWANKKPKTTQGHILIQ